MEKSEYAYIAEQFINEKKGTQSPSIHDEMEYACEKIDDCDKRRINIHIDLKELDWILDG